MASGRRAAGAFRFLVNAWDLQLECARVLHEIFLVPVLMYDRRKRALELGLYR